MLFKDPKNGKLINTVSCGWKDLEYNSKLTVLGSSSDGWFLVYSPEIEGHSNESEHEGIPNFKDTKYKGHLWWVPSRAVSLIETPPNLENK